VGGTDGLDDDAAAVRVDDVLFDGVAVPHAARSRTIGAIAATEEHRDGWCPRPLPLMT
jgi:hypothetical protein